MPIDHHQNTVIVYFVLVANQLLQRTNCVGFADAQQQRTLNVQCGHVDRVNLEWRMWQSQSVFLAFFLTFNMMPPAAWTSNSLLESRTAKQPRVPNRVQHVADSLLFLALQTALDCFIGVIEGEQTAVFDWSVGLDGQTVIDLLKSFLKYSTVIFGVTFTFSKSELTSSVESDVNPLWIVEVVLQFCHSSSFKINFKLIHKYKKVGL
jgi:hypothetical protein